jgi:hypothetical protein
LARIDEEYKRAEEEKDRMVRMLICVAVLGVNERSGGEEWAGMLSLLSHQDTAIQRRSMPRSTNFCANDAL